MNTTFNWTSQVMTLSLNDFFLSYMHIPSHSFLKSLSGERGKNNDVLIDLVKGFLCFFFILQRPDGNHGICVAGFLCSWLLIKSRGGLVIRNVGFGVLCSRG